jgi:hypothetical protein
MKIKEIDNQHKLDEGPLDWLRGKAGAFQGAGTRNKVSKDLYNKWMQSVGMDKTLANNKEALQQFMQKAAPNVPDIAAPTDMSPGGVSNYITTVTGQSLATSMRSDPNAKDWTDRAYGDQAQTNVNIIEPVKTNIPGLVITSGISNPNSEPAITFSGKNYNIDDTSGKWVDELGAPANDKLQNQFYTTMGQYAPNNTELFQGFKTNAGSGAPAGPALSPGVSITNDEPIMIKWKNTDYALNDTGVWAPATNPKKPVSQAMQAFLNKQHDAYLNQTPEPAQAAVVPATQRQSAQAVQSYQDTAAITPAAPAEPVAATEPMVPAATALAQRTSAAATAPVNVQAPPAASPTPSAAVPATPVNSNPAIPNTSYRMPANMQSTGSSQSTMPAPGTQAPAITPKVVYKPIVSKSSKPADQDEFLNQPVAQLESVDLGEVLWRKMKSKRR